MKKKRKKKERRKAAQEIKCREIGMGRKCLAAEAEKTSTVTLVAIKPSYIPSSHPVQFKVITRYLAGH